MDGRVRFGLVGCGDMGLRHLKAYISMSRNGIDLVELTAVCDVRIERAKALASIIREELGLSVSVYNNFIDMCDYADIDAVDIVVPPLYHHSLAISCLEKGKHALVEKPFGITVRSCWRMIEAAKENNRLVAVAENYRRTYHSRALFSLLSQNIIGDVYFVFKNGITALGNRVWIKVLDRQPSTWRHDRLKMGHMQLNMGLMTLIFFGIGLVKLMRYMVLLRCLKSLDICYWMVDVKRSELVLTTQISVSSSLRVVLYVNGV